ncbi:MAG TPA: LysR substrate-binding domain-containing protein [Bradyrhizobium sp.]|nr:LysR substrate-binding domain-containing protein [Bradyrhizobium sp.]
MRYFARVVELGNMTRAAEQLSVAQPALGLQIRQLERDLGVALLVRHSRGVEPTAAGRLLFDRARAILQLVESTEQELSSLSGDSRETITLGLAPSIMLLLGSDIVVDARRDLPQVFLSIVEELSFVLAEAMERDELDLALAYEVAERPGLRRTPVMEEDLLLVTAPEDPIPGETIAFADAIDRDLVLPGERDMVRRVVQGIAEQHSLSVNVAYEVQSIVAMKSLVRRRAAAAIMPYGTAAEELRQGTLIGTRIDRPAVRRTLCFIRPAKRGPFRNETELLNFLDRVVANLADVLGPLARRIQKVA